MRGGPVASLAKTYEERAGQWRGGGCAVPVIFQWHPDDASLSSVPAYCHGGLTKPTIPELVPIAAARARVVAGVGAAQWPTSETNNRARKPRSKKWSMSPALLLTRDSLGPNAVVFERKASSMQWFKPKNPRGRQSINQNMTSFKSRAKTLQEKEKSQHK